MFKKYKLITQYVNAGWWCDKHGTPHHTVHFIQTKLSPLFCVTLRSTLKSGGGGLLKCTQTCKKNIKSQSTALFAKAQDRFPEHLLERVGERSSVWQRRLQRFTLYIGAEGATVLLLVPAQMVTWMSTWRRRRAAIGPQNRRSEPADQCPHGVGGKRLRQLHKANIIA